ncbi:MAG: hypothetical protein CML42_06535 [Rhodobacteraceae bacterium]|nr:hypothetical protein [Paracoccaceae bacterium]|tara:strand:+ start:27146 stop:27715 length:570 start_codon:yes stop_codon:yes gene_type:complete
MDEHVSKIAFLFLAFAVVSGGFVTQILSCQMQEFLNTNMYAKHFIGFLLIFVFIMMEGGWSFDQKIQDKSEVDWSNGNIIDSLCFGAIIYLVFLLTSKMRLIQNILFYFVLFGIYLVNTQRLYWKNRDMLTKELDANLLSVINKALYVCGILFLYGIVDYYIYERKEIGKRFSMLKFILGTRKCSNLSN